MSSSRCGRSVRCFRSAFPTAFDRSIPTMPVTVRRSHGSIPPTGMPITVTNDMTNFGWEYVWHCHILGHEENDMMRPISFAVASAVPLAPGTLSASSVPGQITLRWLDTTPPATSMGFPTNEVGFLIERSTNGGAWTQIGRAPANAQLYHDDAFTPNTPTRYRVYAYNAAGTSPASNIVSAEAAAAPPLVLSSLVANRTFPFVANGTTSITWTATATGGIVPLQYQFWRYNAATAAWTVVQAYGPSNTYTWTPSGGTAGSFGIVVWVKNSGSTTTTADAALGTPGFTITAGAPLAITSVNANVTFPFAANGASITWTATATGGIAPVQYEFWRYSGATGVWTVVQPYGPANTYTWTPVAGNAGFYAIAVWAKNAGSVSAVDASAGTPGFTITGPVPIAGVNANVTFPFVADGITAITWTAAVTGGIAPLQYEFWRYSAATGIWTIVQPYSTTSTYTWTPTAADTGSYAIALWVKNASSASAVDASAGTAVFAITAPIPSVGVNANVTFPFSAGAGTTAITWTATATGGLAPLQYEFWRYNFSTAVWTIVQPYSTTNTFTWTPTAADAGTYGIAVWVRNAGSVAAVDASAGTPGFKITP